MRVLVHDNVKVPHQLRADYLMEQVTDVLNRFGSSIGKVEVTLTLEGHNGAAVTHCHVAADVGSLGIIVADRREQNEHHAFKGALARLVRGISRRIGKQQTKRRSAEPAAQTEPALSGL